MAVDYLEADLEGRAGGSRPLFCNHLVFCNPFAEQQTVLTEVKLIINNAPLTYQNTTKICLTLNHLLLFILTQDQL